MLTLESMRICTLLFYDGRGYSGEMGTRYLVRTWDKISNEDRVQVISSVHTADLNSTLHLLLTGFWARGSGQGHLFPIKSGGRIF
jgi:hypothetical protein